MSRRRARNLDVIATLRDKAFSRRALELTRAQFVDDAVCPFASDRVPSGGAPRRSSCPEMSEVISKPAAGAQISTATSASCRPRQRKVVPGAGNSTTIG